MGYRTGNLIFQDDFNRGDVLNAGTQTWNTTFPGGGRVLPQLGERQIFLDDNKTVLPTGSVSIDPIKIADGSLHIEAKPTPGALLGAVANHPYTSGMVNTGMGLFDFKYGYVEVRAQVPTGEGLLPTFYMVRSDKAQLGEIDLFEIIGNNSKFLNQTVHASNNGISTTEKYKVVRDALPVDLSKDFHTYGVDWNPQTITFYLDGVAKGHIATPESLKAPMFLIGHVGVGGTWTGMPNGSTPWPATMKVDYVKVWQDAGQTAPGTKAGGAGSESMAGGDGNDVLRGLGGNDTILGARGNDMIDGGDGNDRLLGGMGNDTLVAGGGSDTLEGGRGDDTYVITNPGNVILDHGGGGFDTVETTLSRYAAGATVEGLVFKGAGSFNGIGAWADNRIVGGSGNDVLLGGAGDDTLVGNAGHDKLNGGIGNDVLYAGSGNDTLMGDSGSDLFVFSVRDGGGTALVTDFTRGVDKLNVAGLGFTSFADVLSHQAMNGQGNLVLSKNGESIVLQGVKAGQLASGDLAWSTADLPASAEGSGTPGNSPDTGSDQPTDAPASTSITGDRYANLLNGTAGDDRLTGCDGSDTLNGSSGDDWLNGGAGADRLNAGSGHDTMIGNTGADVFVFGAVTAGSRAEVMDFQEGVDRLSVAGLGLRSMADVMAHASNSADGVQITAGGETIVLHDTKLAALHGSDFIF